MALYVPSHSWMNFIAYLTNEYYEAKGHFVAVEINDGFHYDKLGSVFWTPWLDR